MSSPLYIVKVKSPSTGRWHTLREGHGLIRLYESRRDADDDRKCLIGIATRAEPYFGFFPTRKSSNNRETIREVLEKHRPFARSSTDTYCYCNWEGSNSNYLDHLTDVLSIELGLVESGAEGNTHGNG